jgi:hypothetical protein
MLPASGTPDARRRGRRRRLLVSDEKKLRHHTPATLIELRAVQLDLAGFDRPRQEGRHDGVRPDH